ncbi:acyltransferase family protein [Bradyrhizobium sp. USDA 4353]
MKQFAGLDVVRTFLALSVATGHYFYWNGVQTRYPSAFFLAVDFFFILSGFVLVQSLLFYDVQHVGSFLRMFAIRRIFRLYPLYGLLFLPSVLISALNYGGALDRPFHYLASVFLLQGVGVIDGIPPVLDSSMIGVAWSISVELWAGLLFFPLVFIFRNQKAGLVVFCLVVMLCAWSAMLASPNYFNVNLQRFWGLVALGFVRGLLGFALGSLCYLIWMKMSRVNISRSKITIVELTSIGLLGLFLPLDYDRRLDFVAPLILAVALVAIAAESGWIGAALTSVKFAFARPLSYSIYLLHPFSISFMKSQRVPFDNAHLLPYLASLVLMAIPAYYFVERPGIDLGRRSLARLAVLNDRGSSK